MNQGPNEGGNMSLAVLLDFVSDAREVGNHHHADAVLTLLRRDWAVRVLDAWADSWKCHPAPVDVTVTQEPLPPDRELCSCPKHGPSAPTYWGSPRAIQVGHGPRCPWLDAHREYLAAGERAARERLNERETRSYEYCGRDPDPENPGLYMVITRDPDRVDHMGPTPDAARLAAAEAVWPELPESVRAELGERP